MRIRKLVHLILTVFLLSLTILTFLPFNFPFKVPKVKAQTTATLWVNAFDNVRTGWTRVGSSPYLDAKDQPTNYVYNDNTVVAYQKIGDFHFPNLPTEATDVTSVTLWVYADTASPFVYFWIYVWDGSVWNEVTCYHGPWSWKSYDLSTVLDTVEKVNNAKIYLDSAGFGVVIKCDAVYLEVEYTVKTWPQSSNLDFNSTIPFSSCNMSSYWTDSSGLSGFIFSLKVGTGNWENDTWQAIAGSPTSATVYKIETLPSYSSKHVEFKFYVNNTLNLWNVSDAVFIPLQPVYDVKLYVDTYLNETQQWSVYGTSPFLNQELDNNYIESTDIDQLIGNFTFQNLFSTFQNVEVLTLNVLYKPRAIGTRLIYTLYSGSIALQYESKLTRADAWNWDVINLFSDYLPNPKLKLNDTILTIEEDSLYYPTKVDMVFIGINLTHSPVLWIMRDKYERPPNSPLTIGQSATIFAQFHDDSGLSLAKFNHNASELWLSDNLTLTLTGITS